jgi:uncharacterized membrane protein SpoIIM required for sporulation
MTVNDFIKLHEKDWQRLHDLTRRARRQALGTAEVHELGELYRGAMSDLALARRDYPDHRLTTYLNQLLTQAHNTLYQQDTTDLHRLTQFITQTVPRTFRSTWPFTLTAFLVFIAPALIGFRLASVDPAIADPLGLVELRDILANHETWTDIPIEDRPYASTFIMSNNIRVALLAFGGGVLLGLFTVYVLAINGLSIGAILGLAAHYNMDGALLDFIVGHGVVELSVIFIAGGAGLQLGWAILNPGRYTRRDSLAIAARRAVTLAAIGIPLLIMAGLIEGFISPSDLPSTVKIAVGFGSGALVYAYLLLAGQNENPNVH